MVASDWTETTGSTPQGWESSMFLLAANISSTGATVIGAVVGLVIVAALIVAFVLGSRRKEKEPVPDLDPMNPVRDSWATPRFTPGHEHHGDPLSPVHHT